MYYIVVATLMLAFPVLSVAVEAARFSTAIDSILIGKWFVFWSVGWRLLLAGVRQIAQPEYTAREILGLQSAESWTVVRELGFGNLALGIVGVLSLWLPSWHLPLRSPATVLCVRGNQPRPAETSESSRERCDGFRSVRGIDSAELLRQCRRADELIAGKS